MCALLLLPTPELRIPNAKKLAWHYHLGRQWTLQSRNEADSRTISPANSKSVPKLGITSFQFWSNYSTMEEVESLYSEMIPLCSRNSTKRRMRLTNPSSESCSLRRSFLPALSLLSSLQSLYSMTKKVWKRHCRHSSRSISSPGSPSSKPKRVPKRCAKLSLPVSRG